MNQGQFIRGMEDFGKDLRRLLDGVNQPSILYGNVDSIDEESKTINVRIGDAGLVIPDISLSGVIGGDASVIFYPALDSAVILGIPYQQPENAFVVSYTRVDKVEAAVGEYFCKIDKESIYLSKEDGASVTISGDTVTMNGGEIGGMVIPNAINDAINAFVSVFNSHTHQFTWSGSAGTADTLTPTQQAQSLNADDYTNDKVMQ